MGNRNAKKERRYDSNGQMVIGKIGGLDNVVITEDGEYVVNKQGAKVYTKDVTRHLELKIPQIQQAGEKGKVYTVLSAGMVGNVPIVTIKQGELPIVFRIPMELSDWVNHLRSLSLMGNNLLPCEVEFGYNVEQRRYYAEML